MLLHHTITDDAKPGCARDDDQHDAAAWVHGDDDFDEPTATTDGGKQIDSLTLLPMHCPHR